jgi:acyl-CoA thioester hydrolase
MTKSASLQPAAPQRSDAIQSPASLGRIIRAMHSKRMQIRWRDVDAYQHVNNSVYLTYLEEVRDAWFARTVASVEGAGDFVLARVAIDYRRELTLEDEELVATCRLIGFGNSSVTTHEEIRSAEGWLAAEAESVMVAHDSASRRARPFSEAERTELQRQLEIDAAPQEG